MATFRSPFVRKDTTRGSRPVDGRLALAGLLTPADDVAALPGILSGLVVSGVAGQWYYAVSGGHGVTVRSTTDGANMPGLDGVTNTPTVAVAPSSGSRWDLIYLRQQDVDAGDSTSDSVLGVVQGMADGTPTKPYADVPAGALVLAEAQVGSGATSTLHANVTITQVAAKVGLRGGIIANPSTAQQALLDAAATSSGSPIWFDDAGVLKRTVGAGGVIVAPKRGRAVLVGTVGAVANSTVGNVSWTATGQDVDPTSMHTASGANVVIPWAGLWRATTAIGFATNATGMRVVSIKRNGTTVVEDTRPASPSGPTQITVSMPEMQLAAGDVITVSVWQNSGGSLNLDQSECPLRLSVVTA